MSCQPLCGVGEASVSFDDLFPRKFDAIAVKCIASCHVQIFSEVCVIFRDYHLFNNSQKQLAFKVQQIW
jgi:hypothetical protein